MSTIEVERFVNISQSAQMAFLVLHCSTIKYFQSNNNFFEDLKFESWVPELHDSMMFTAIFKELVIVDYRE